MIRQTVLPLTIALYQIVRFSLLGFVILTDTRIGGAPIVRSAVLAFASGALVGAVLAIQYGLTGSRTLLVPLRTLKGVETLASALALLNVLVAPTVPNGAEPAIARFVGVLAVADATILVYLLLSREKRVG